MNDGDVSPVVSVTVDAEVDDEFECTTDVNATIKVNRQEVGSMHMYLIDRNFGYNFHTPCDAVNQDLQCTGVTFCDRFGHVRLDSLHKFKPAVDNDGFLYIDTFKIDANKLMRLFLDSDSNEPSRMKPKTEEKDDEKSKMKPLNDALYRRLSYVGAMALREVLAHPLLDGRWQLAAYIPESDNIDWLSAADKKAKSTLSAKIDAHHRSRMLDSETVNNVRGLAPDEDALFVRLCNESLAGDARPFFRAGFEQVCDLNVVENADCSYLFAVPSFLESVSDDIELMSHEKCVDVVIKQKKVRNEPAGKDLELQNLLAKLVDYNHEADSQLSSTELARVSAEIDALVAQGASVEKSSALHLCVANADARVIDLLVEKGGKQILDARDSKGCTPLMVAAHGAIGTKRRGHSWNLDCVKALLRLGADPTPVDFTGLSAIGHAWTAQVNTNDFVQCMGLEVDSIECDMEILEAMLMPDGGASKADLAKKKQLNIQE